MSRFFILFHLFFFILLSCSRGGEQPVNLTNPNLPTPTREASPEPAPEIIRKTTKIPDPVKQKKCSTVDRNVCGDNKKCEDICDDIFSNRSDKRKCYKYSESLVYDFEQILEDIEDGEVEGIDPETLDCMLDIDEREFAQAVKEMSTRESKEFLFAIVQDSDLAKVLEEEDDEFNILKQLLHKATKSRDDIKKQLKEEIEEDKGFLWLAAEYNEYSWEWLDNYIEDYCESGPDECLDEENISAYCSVLVTFRDNDLEDFLGDADFFAEEYEDEVEDADYVYAVDSDPGDRYNGDFKTWCNRNIPAECPADGTEPDTANRLARITLEADQGAPTYQQRDFCYRETASAPSNPNIDTRRKGSSDPSDQDLIIRLSGHGNGGSVFFNQDAIDEIKTYSASSNTYYLYIDDDRYVLDDNEGRDVYSYDNDTPTRCTSLDEMRVLAISRLSLGLTATTYNVYLASERNGICTYYR